MKIPRLKETTAARRTTPQVITADGAVRQVEGVRVPVDRRPGALDFESLIAKHLGVESLAEIAADTETEQPAAQDQTGAEETPAA